MFAETTDLIRARMNAGKHLAEIKVAGLPDEYRAMDRDCPPESDEYREGGMSSCWSARVCVHILQVIPSLVMQDKIQTLPLFIRFDAQTNRRIDHLENNEGEHPTIDHSKDNAD